MRNKTRTDFYKTKKDEEEAQINIDYLKRTLDIYTSKKSVYNRLLKKLGEPTIIYRTQGQVSGARWKIPFKDTQRIKIALSKPILFGEIGKTQKK